MALFYTLGPGNRGKRRARVTQIRIGGMDTNTSPITDPREPRLALRAALAEAMAHHLWLRGTR